jgi:hypothetical protein
MKRRKFLSYLIAAAMLAGMLMLPVSASAHGYRGHGPHGHGLAWRHHSAPKWRSPRRYARTGRQYCETPGRRVFPRAYDTAPRVRLGRGSEIGVIYRGYRD